jgi:protein-arginine kinase activator protein McsA
MEAIPKCDSCQRRPAKNFYFEMRDDGTLSRVGVCWKCDARRPKPTEAASSEIDRDFGQNTREQLWDLLRRSK